MSLIKNDLKLDFDDVLLVPKRTRAASRKSVSVERDFQFYHSNRTWSGTPIMAANMDTTGTIDMADRLWAHDMITCLHKHYTYPELAEFFNDVHEAEKSWLMAHAWVSIGIKDHDFDRLDALVTEIEGVPNICIDVANGYTDDFVKHCSKIREHYATNDEYPIIMAGNVCTPEMVQELILHGGVDIVKVGIGPGSACTTRLKTGVGYPQLSAIAECSHAAHGLKSYEKRLGLICADGGCRTPGDVCKAFAANADFVMLGGMLAGTDECEGKWLYRDPTFPKNTLKDLSLLEELERESIISSESLVKAQLEFYGMSSEHAQDKHCGEMKNYKTSEGRVKYIDYKGSAEHVLRDIVGGIRSCCSYIGSTSIKDMSKCADFVRVARKHYDQTI